MSAIFKVFKKKKKVDHGIDISAPVMVSETTNSVNIVERSESDGHLLKAKKKTSKKKEEKSKKDSEKERKNKTSEQRKQTSSNTQAVLGKQQSEPVFSTKSSATIEPNPNVKNTTASQLPNQDSNR